METLRRAPAFKFWESMSDTGYRKHVASFLHRWVGFVYCIAGNGMIVSGWEETQAGAKASVCGWRRLARHAYTVGISVAWTLCDLDEEKRG
ncbi:unnamed protein product [Microthlaspi erraticum]|uniref:Uncharacterized protein n=1 Tax=Microthlaspi erraticum TaxID=1685480 RepID=A0A6D2KYJ3_9BRAS|nr:unnamed protein product [Microthlaspi erraticum]